jgi:hypothetical protein
MSGSPSVAFSHTRPAVTLEAESPNPAGRRDMIGGKLALHLLVTLS